MGNSFAIPMSRRSFMKLMGLAAAGTVLGVKWDAAKAEAASPTIATMDFDNAELPVLFDADVCVVGGGVAGTAAAVTAARKGAKVVLVVLPHPANLYEYGRSGWHCCCVGDFSRNRS